MFKYIGLIVFVCCFNLPASIAQNAVTDSLRPFQKVSRVGDEMHYNVGNGKTLVYPKPKKFAFITNLPKDAAGIVSTTFKKESIKPLLAIAASTTLLLFADQAIVDETRNFSDRIGLSGDEKNVNLLKFKTGEKEVALFRLPANLNTAFYQLGQGFPSLAIGAGLFTYGKIKNDYRALSTASQLAESFILMGVGTQIVKRISGRESPTDATAKGGRWDFLPSFSDYQNNTPKFDAFPSGHVATMMSSITIFAENYPEKRWIRPVGYSLTALVAYSMINNKVHWASDYPLAVGMGFLCAKQVVKRNRKVVTSATATKKRGELDYTFGYVNGAFTPGILYKF